MGMLRDELQAAEHSGLYNSDEVKNIYSSNSIALFLRLKAVWGKAGVM